MNERVTFRLDEELKAEIHAVTMELIAQGFDLDDSKVVRYLIKKGIEKLKEEKGR